ncbi:hypothetical protein [Vitiosangium sp. GDMCC 1.1324]|uniref:hypothetical protein n=1 Tax=Vitiosangium sp. (strain GDMCC 1.1324) TaxID=2138576 RepID=UPI000D3D769E|nr:hypothetical protein [Vitiosangium sp. GDMCC 1.1324]PTL79953.1 hypothetical protein DAT35_31525 [Vitiosangium sp. GDMCC 1.1324]
MNLRSTIWAVAALMAGGMMGCGKQPSYYRVAIDTAPLSNLPPSCYRSGTPPTDDTTSNVVTVDQWVIWDGVDDRKYLQTGDISYPLGDAQVTITAGDAIVSSADKDKTTFVVERTRTNPSRSLRATYTFDSLGQTAEGTLALSYSCTGTGCDPNCDASLHFVGRLLDVDPTLIVNNTAG